MMKQSVNPYIGLIPSDWKEIKNAYLFKKRRIIVGDDWDKTPLLSLTTEGVKYKDINNNEGKVPADYTGYQLAKEGDMILCLFDLDCSAVFADLSSLTGMVSPAYRVVECNDSLILNRFAKYWFDAIGFRRLYIFHSKSLRYTINEDIFNNIYTAVPSIEKQIKICDFLDSKISLIEKTLDELRKTIDVLKTYKRNKTTEICLTNCGEETISDERYGYLPYFPKSAQLMPIKFILKNVSIKDKGDETVLSLYRDIGVIPKDSRTDNHNVTGEDTNKYKYVEAGDFVINKMKAWQGSMAVSKYTGIISPAYHVCKFTKKDINLDYFHYLIRGVNYIPEFLKLSAGIRIGQWDLSFDDFSNIVVPLVSLNDQAKVVEKIEAFYPKVDLIVNKIEDLISKIETYKESLVFEYATGKKEVC